LSAEKGKREFGLQLAKGIKGGGSSQLHAKGSEGRISKMKQQKGIQK